MHRVSTVRMHFNKNYYTIIARSVITTLIMLIFLIFHNKDLIFQPKVEFYNDYRLK